MQHGAHMIISGEVAKKIVSSSFPFKKNIFTIRHMYIESMIFIYLGLGGGVEFDLGALTLLNIDATIKPLFIYIHNYEILNKFCF